MRETLLITLLEELEILEDLGLLDSMLDDDA